MRVQSLGEEDPLDKEMAAHSSILAQEIQWTEEPGRLQSTGSQESDTTQQLNNKFMIIPHKMQVNDTSPNPTQLSILCIK